MSKVLYLPFFHAHFFKRQTLEPRVRELVCGDCDFSGWHIIDSTAEVVDGTKITVFCAVDPCTKVSVLPIMSLKIKEEVMLHFCVASIAQLLATVFIRCIYSTFVEPIEKVAMQYRLLVTQFTRRDKV